MLYTKHSSGIDCGTADYAAGGDPYVATEDSDMICRAAGGNERAAVRIDGNIVRHAAGGNIEIAAIDGVAGKDCVFYLERASAGRALNVDARRNREVKIRAVVRNDIGRRTTVIEIEGSSGRNRGMIRRTPEIEIERSSGRNRGMIRRTPGIEMESSSGRNRGMIRQTVVVNPDTAVVVDRGIVYRTAIDLGESVDDGVACRAARGNNNPWKVAIQGVDDRAVGKAAGEDAEGTAGVDDGVKVGLAGTHDSSFVFKDDSDVRDGLVDVRDRIAGDLGFVPGRVDRLEVDCPVVEERNAVHIGRPFAVFADPVQGCDQFLVVRELGGHGHGLVGRLRDVRRDIGDRRGDGIHIQDVDGQRERRIRQVQGVVPSRDGRLFAESKRAERAPRGIDRDGAVEARRAFREGIDIAADIQGRGHSERVRQRPLNNGKIVHESRTAGSCRPQVEIKDRAVGGNDRAVRERHPSGQSALVVNEQTAAFCDIDIRHCAAAVVDDCAAVGIDGNTVRRSSGTDINAAVIVDRGVERDTADNIDIPVIIDSGTVRLAALVDINARAGTDGRVGYRAAGNVDRPGIIQHGTVRLSAAIDGEVAVVAVEYDVVRHAAVINDETTVPVDIRIIDNGPGVDRGRRIGKDEPADRICRERRICAVLDIHIAAVFDELHRRAAGGNNKVRAGIDRISGNERILDLERAPARCTLDIGVRGNGKVKIRTVIGDDVRRRTAAGNGETTAIGDSNAVRHAAGGYYKIAGLVDRCCVRHSTVINMKDTAPVECRIIGGRAGVNRGGRIGKDQPAECICGKCNVCAILNNYIAAVFDDVRHRAAEGDQNEAAGINCNMVRRAAGNIEIAAVDNCIVRCAATVNTELPVDHRGVLNCAAGKNIEIAVVDVKPGKIRVLDLERAADGSTLDISIRGNREIKPCIVCRNKIRCRTAGGDPNVAAGINRDMICRASGHKEIPASVHIDPVRYAASINIHVSVGVDVRMIRDTAGQNIEKTAVVDRNIVRRSAGGDVHPSVPGERGVVHRAAGGDGDTAVPADGRTVRHTAVIDIELAVQVDGCIVCHAAGRNIELAVPVDGRAVRHAAGRDVHNAALGHIGAFRRAAVKDIESAAGDDRAVIELAGIDVPRFVRQDDAAGDDGIRRLAADREGQVARKERKRVRHAGDLDRSPDRQRAEQLVRRVHHGDRLFKRIQSIGKQIETSRLVRVDGKRIGRRALNHRKPRHKRRAASGRSGQIEVEDRTIIH